MRENATCYKIQWEKESNDLYRWNDLDGKRPTMEEYQEQEKRCAI